MSIRNFFPFLLCILLSSLPLKAEQIDDDNSLQISFLTCAPGNAAYELYGHTALRVIDERSGSDLVYNYGIFDFDTPNFAWRFMLGETDYTIGVTYFSSFAHSYRRHGRAVVEQILNLRPDEKLKLVESLNSDWARPGWTYRYNFIYDNCTTRAYGQVKNAVDGKLILPDGKDNKHSFRDILHEYAAESSPWTNFGDDLLLGSEVDLPIPVELQMFSPLYAEKYLDSAYVLETDGTRRPLVKSKIKVVEAEAVHSVLFPVSPMEAVVLLLILVAGCTAWERKKRRVWYILDYLLMALQGTAGCIIAFLFFVSQHPAVDTNWLILLLNPLPLVVLPVKIWRDKHHLRDFYYPVLGMALLAFLISALFQVQNYPLEIYVVALILLIRAIASYKRKGYDGMA